METVGKFGVNPLSLLVLLSEGSTHVMFMEIGKEIKAIPE